MTAAARRALFWAPRGLGILFAIFISLFALDAFGGERSAIEILTALAIHLVPTALVVVALVIAWRWEGIGALLFLGLALLYLATMWGRLPMASSYVLIAGPLTLIGVLFLLGRTARA
jgi:hypothetical protein